MNDIVQHDPSQTRSAIFNPTSLEKLQIFAEQMALSRVTIPNHLVGKPADCLAVALQAVQWNMNPYAVAQKTSVVNGGLCYEAQLVNAVVTSSHAVQSRFKYEYGGEWDKYRPGDKSDNAEKGLCVRVGAVLTGDKEVTWGEWLYLEFIKVRNSPLWTTAPKQQFGYLAVKYWARLYTPDVILGVYTPDEMTQPIERDVTPVPAPQTVTELNQVIGKTVTVQAETHEKETRSPEEILERFRIAASNTKTVDELDQCYAYCILFVKEDPELMKDASEVYENRRKTFT
ncbi:recombinase RecT [Pantoea sp. Al-1710]|uniref:Recombinase RecT n=1 Tax=Candidatus Pantoea communis TaxID=2608354 RepID=A0ABX0RI65_9GAMM|nr:MULTISPECIES: RecT family recombinase [Pantoea]NIG12966.1 recombinase RecT [Pantoea sp. Cy-640]NIG17333.1 recombinase RecT [Pantoea communis]